MAIIKINSTLFGHPFVSVTFPADGPEHKVYATGNLVADWYAATAHCLNAIIGGKTAHRWVNTDTYDFDHSDAFHDYMVGWLIPNVDGWMISYRKPDAGPYAKLYLPRDKPFTYEELTAYCKQHQSQAA